MFIVGLTGGISTGKSTVSEMFTKLNVPIIDADLVARQVVKPGKKAWYKIRSVFGDDILESDGQINRKKLADIIFSDAQLRKKLNAITHPQIAKEITWNILKFFLKGYQFVIIDSPLLFEANTWVNFVHKIIVVSCEESIQLERLMTRNQLTEPEALARITAQISLQDKRKRAHYIIENSEDLENTRDQVIKIYKQLRQSQTHWKIRITLAAVVISVTTALTYITSSHWICS